MGKWVRLGTVCTLDLTKHWLLTWKIPADCVTHLQKRNQFSSPTRSIVHYSNQSTVLCGIEVMWTLTSRPVRRLQAGQRCTSSDPLMEINCSPWFHKLCWLLLCFAVSNTRRVSILSKQWWPDCRPQRDNWHLCQPRNCLSHLWCIVKQDHSYRKQRGETLD